MIPLIVTEWLQKRKMKVPDALLLQSTSTSTSTTATIVVNNVDDVILRHLPGLRERERRALVRHVTKTIAIRRQTDAHRVAAAGGSDDGRVGEDNQPKMSAIDELEGSDGEYYYEDSYNVVQQQICNVKNDSNNGSSGGDDSIDCWPNNVIFSNEYKWDDQIPHEIKELYCPSSQSQSQQKQQQQQQQQQQQKQQQPRRQRSNRRSNKVYIRKIHNPAHPAYGQYGLYCAIDHAKPGSWLLDYIGHVTLGEHQNNTSDYICDFGLDSELSCDALSYGNESRYINDFRNTGHYPNVEFNLRRDANGNLRQGVYVKQVKDMVRRGGGVVDFDGIHRDEELLISYGKNYWRSRVGNLSDFVTVWPNNNKK
jgi:flagellum-specific peptidoglycan hydrolase FlgJ